jgi:hypothetical protein
MMRTLCLLLIVTTMSSLTACGGSDEPVVASKELCLLEVSKKLLDCAENPDCEKGVVRYAGYCYNEAPGDQMDICRGGQYFFEQPIKKLAETHPEIIQLNQRQRNILIRSGELYCNYNFN